MKESNNDNDNEDNIFLFTFFGVRIVNFHCIQQNVHILIAQFFLQIGRIPINKRITAIRELARFKRNPVYVK